MPLALLGALLLGQKSYPPALVSLSMARSQYNARFGNRGGPLMDSMPLESHNDGYYPIGKSDRGFLICLGSSPEEIAYQTTNGKSARTEWRVLLQKAHGKCRFSGSMGRYLYGLGYQPSGKLNSAQKSQLNLKIAYAAYDRTGPASQSWYAWVVHKDGTTTKGILFHDTAVCPITPDEAEALGFGRGAYLPEQHFPGIVVRRK